MIKTQKRFEQLSIRMEIERFVKVKAYVRFRNGKIERVKSHYRKY